MFCIQDAGRLLIHPGPLVFLGRQLELVEDLAPGAVPSKPRASSSSAGGKQSFVPRAAGGRQRLGLGAKHKEAVPNVSSESKTQSSSVSSNSGRIVGKGQDDFRKMLG